MKRLITTLTAVFLTASGCALLQDAAKVTGVDRAMATNRDLRAVQGAGTEMVATIQKCEEASKLEISVLEEKEMGGAVALSLGSRYGKVLIEPAPAVAALDLNSLATMKGKTVTPGKGPLTDLHLYVDRVGKALAAASTRPTLPWTFIVLDSPAENAFSAPGGYVVVSRGLLAKLASEDELAGVLAHEIVHVTRKHALESYRRSKNAACNAAGAAQQLAKLGGGAAKMVPGLQELVEKIGGGSGFDPAKLSKDAIVWLTEKASEEYEKNGAGPEQEFEADAEATSMLVFAGYDPRAFADMLGKLPKGAFISPHPDGSKRQEKVLAQVNGEYAAFARPAGKLVELAPEFGPAKK